MAEKLEVGDRVRITVLGTKANEHDIVDDYLSFKLDGHQGYYGFNPKADGIKIERLSIKAGDRVILIGSGLVRTVIHVHDGKAWLDDGRHTHGLVNIDQLVMAYGR